MKTRVATKGSTPAVRPSDAAAYLRWARDTHKIDFDRNAGLYGVNINAAFTSVNESAAWPKLLEHLRDAEKGYKAKHSASLYFDKPKLEIYKKSYTSVIDKTFRKNVVLNDNWPRPPKGGWVTPDTLYTAIDDLLRTTVVSQFFDGPKFLLESLKDLCRKLGLSAYSRVHNRTEGYYGHHLYIGFPVRLAATSGKTRAHTLNVEIQMTTVTQDLLRKLTHPYYSEERSSLPDPAGAPWQWENKTNKFRARYLSHTLHLLEALILDVRDHKDGKR